MDSHIPGICVWIGIFLLFWYFRRRRPKLSQTAHGTAAWATGMMLQAAGMIGGKGLVLGRTQSGALIRLVQYTHVLLVGGTGSGKGVGFVIPNAKNFSKNFSTSLVVNDTKGDIYQIVGRRQRGKTVRLSPFNRGGSDAFNPCDLIGAGPLLIDEARTLAESVVVRQNTGGVDPHWAINLYSV